MTDHRLFSQVCESTMMALVLCGCSPPVESTGARFFLSHPGYLAAVDEDLQPATYARRLMASPDGEPYALLLLAGNGVFEEAANGKLGDEEPAVSDMFARFQNAYVIAVIKALPPDPSPPMLWALTGRLDDHGTGLWSESPHEGVHVECESPPMREVARDALVKSLNVDHGFDRAGWRREIVRRAINRK